MKIFTSRLPAGLRAEIRHDGPRVRQLRFAWIAAQHFAGVGVGQGLDETLGVAVETDLQIVGFDFGLERRRVHGHAPLRRFRSDSRLWRGRLLRHLVEIGRSLWGSDWTHRSIEIGGEPKLPASFRIRD
jgi:hypothetical protein